MEGLIDFSKTQQNEETYGGMSGRKLGITYNDINYLVKFPKRESAIKNPDQSYTNSPLAEFLGSHVYEILGFNVHKTFLARFRDKLVCACEDFTSNGCKLKEFGKYKVTYYPDNDAIDDSDALNTDGSSTDLNEILDTIEHHPLFEKNRNEIKEHFWNMFIVDALIGNTDRNNGNWGLLLDSNGNKSIAPIYDNGNSFFTHYGQNKIRANLNNAESLKLSSIERTCVFCKDNKKINPYHLIKNMKYVDCNKALLRLLPSIIQNRKIINTFINEIPNTLNEIPIITSEQKEFYNKVLDYRIDNLLLPTYQMLHS